MMREETELERVERLAVGPDGDGPKTRKHPAPYSKNVLATVADVLARSRGDSLSWKVYDPFAGIGRVFLLEQVFPGMECYGTEIEAEWVSQHPRHYHADAFDFMAHPSHYMMFDVVVTSPTYGNRMADHHDAKDGSRRITYRHYLGRPLHENNSGGMQWGKKYREFHEAAWRAVWQVLKPDGMFLLNISDHIRQWEQVPVSKWHLQTCEQLGFECSAALKIETPRMKFGENSSRRVANEWLFVMKKVLG